MPRMYLRKGSAVILGHNVRVDIIEFDKDTIHLFLNGKDYYFKKHRRMLINGGYVSIGFSVPKSEQLVLDVFNHDKSLPINEFGVWKKLRVECKERDALRSASLMRLNEGEVKSRVGNSFTDLLERYMEDIDGHGVGGFEIRSVVVEDIRK